METTSEKIHKTTPVNIDMMLDNVLIVPGNHSIGEKQNVDFVKRRQHYETFKDSLLLLKVKTLDDEVVQVKDRLSKLEQLQHTQRSLNADNFFTNAVEPQKSNVEKKLYLDDNSTLQECESIVERAIEIVTEWSKTQDIKLQIQYAAVIVGKIENIKKKEFIQENEIRKKICTLLRTVIRLNVTDTVFTKEQLLLLKRGFSLLVSDSVQKEDMLQLAREFRSEHLMTIPAWE